MIQKSLTQKKSDFLNEDFWTAALKTKTQQTRLA